jgi:hypothetical protein
MKGSRVCRLWAATAIGFAVTALFAPGMEAQPQHAGPCRPWTMRTLVSGQGLLENLEPDGHGGMLISAWQRSQIDRLTPAGRVSTLLAGVNAPGGLRVRGSTLYFTTGDNPISGSLNIADGTIDRLDLDTGARSTWAGGLTMPNGLEFLPNADAVVSRALGTVTGITRVRASDPGHPQINWSTLQGTNGLGVDLTGRWLYASVSSSADSPIYRVRISDPSDVELVANLSDGIINEGLDDLAVSHHGVTRGDIFVAANAASEIFEVNPVTGHSCMIASAPGWFPTSVKFGRGPGWRLHSLYVTAFDGTVRELDPPRQRRR